MKKLALAVAILASGAGAYWYSQQQSQNALSNPALDYIPADTPFFSAQLKPFPLKDYLKASAANSAMMADDPVLNELLADTSEPAIRFGAYLYKAYLDGLKNPDALIKRFGFAEQPRGYFYTLGAVPVARMEIADTAAFWALLDEAETNSGFKHTTGTVAGQTYRAYAIIEPSAAGSAENTENTASTEKVELVIAERDGLVTVTLNTSLQDASLLENALGVTKVSNPISDTTILADIIKTHGFLEDSISYINHQELVSAVVSGENQLGKQLSTLFADEAEDPFAGVRTPECKTELNAIAANWPRTVAGLTALKVDSQQTSMDMKLVVETQNTALLAALDKIRGFLPAYARDPQNSVVALGLGVEVSQLAPSMAKILDDVLKPQLKCQPLAELQAQLTELDPAMLGMATGIADGVKGIGAAVLDYQLDMVDDEPQLKKLDALISLSAEDPTLLFNMVKPFIPMLGQIDLKAGEDVDLSEFIPPEFGVSAKLGLRGQHMVVYSGEVGKKAADSLASEKLSVNGLFGMTADYGRMMGPLITLVEASGEAVPPELKGMENLNMKIQMTLDVNGQGPVFNSGFVMKP